MINESTIDTITLIDVVDNTSLIKMSSKIQQEKTTITRVDSLSFQRKR